ncbi:hypothetical protein [Anaeromyxobacter oryzisoli]|uniref:hypothetical protein n=1 Tax=Anaeromyxobacter oryzisoli TaxID=2925408 RepID=UPI001F5777FB|nr:hypothetical protein [Anaeromyxobacter sp. SG63]
MRPPLATWSSRLAGLAARLLIAFAFYAAALELGGSIGLVGAVGSPIGLALLGASGLLFLGAAVCAGLAAGPRGLRAARALVLSGLGLSVAALPASLAFRTGGTVAVGEGQTLEPDALQGLPALRFGSVALAPRGPHVLSKTVEIEAEPEGGEPVRIGLFPPTAVAGWRLSVFRFGYAVAVGWAQRSPAPLVDGYVMLGTFPHTAEEAALVTWTPEPNVMMGAGTFPPKLEDLLTPPRSGAHLFLRLEEATIGGKRRDLRDPDAYRWLVDGRLEGAVFHVEALQGKEKLFEGRLRAGESATYPGGAITLGPDVLLWVDLLGTRDPWLAVLGAGLALLAGGVALRSVLAVVGLVRRQAARRT